MVYKGLYQMAETETTDLSLDAICAPARRLRHRDLISYLACAFATQAWHVSYRWTSIGGEVDN